MSYEQGTGQLAPDEFLGPEQPERKRKSALTTKKEKRMRSGSRALVASALLITGAFIGNSCGQESGREQRQDEINQLERELAKTEQEKLVWGQLSNKGFDNIRNVRVSGNRTFADISPRPEDEKACSFDVDVIPGPSLLLVLNDASRQKIIARITATDGQTEDQMLAKVKELNPDCQ